MLAPNVVMRCDKLFFGGALLGCLGAWCFAACAVASRWCNENNKYKGEAEELSNNSGSPFTRIYRTRALCLISILTEFLL